MGVHLDRADFSAHLSHRDPPAFPGSRESREEQGPESQQTWVPIPAPLLVPCAILGESLPLSVAWPPPCRGGNTPGCAGLGAQGSRRSSPRAQGIDIAAAQLGAPTWRISEASGRKVPSLWVCSSGRARAPWRESCDFPNERHLLPNRVLASSSCPVSCVLCVTFAKHSHSPLGVGRIFFKRLEFKHSERFILCNGWNKYHTNYVRSSRAEVGWRPGWGLGGRGGAGGVRRLLDKGFIQKL